MNVVITLENRFIRSPDGSVWTNTVFDYAFWQRYLMVFDRARVVARVQEVVVVPPDWKRADGEHVAFAVVPHYHGPLQYIKRLRQITRAVRDALQPSDAVIMRVGSQLAAALEPLFRRTRRPYGVEVVGDPYDVFAPGALRHPMRPFFRWHFSRQLQRQCAEAAAAAYVTERALQRRYPPSPDAFATHYSSIELPTRAFASAPKRFQAAQQPLRLVSVGTLAQLYKAPDVVISAVSDCIGTGLDLTLKWIGDGKHRTELEALAAELGIADRICFRGQLPAGDTIRAELDQADLFVLASHQEGLPRAMIEAMARGLPCIGSTVGGIPELLPPEDLVPPGDRVALATKIRELVTDPQRMTRMAARNLERAKEYREEVLRERRRAFYAAVRDTTEAWLRGAASP